MHYNNIIVLLITAMLSKEHAAAHIAVLVEADRRGHYSHGFNRWDKRIIQPAYNVYLAWPSPLFAFAKLKLSGTTS